MKRMMIFMMFLFSFPWILNGNLSATNLDGRGYFQYRMMAVGDVDGDGKDELVVDGRLQFRDGLKNCISNMASLLVVYKWDGSRYRAIWTYSGPLDEPSLDALTVGDVNNDGVADIVVESTAYGTPGGHIRAFGHGGNGGFQLLGEIPFSEGVNRRNLAVGDVDNDGQNELVVGGVFYFRGFKIYKFASGSFREVYSKTTGQDCQSVYVADVNNDGENELLIGAGVWSPYQVMLFKYSGGGYHLIWSRSFTNLNGSYGPMLHVYPGDADNDGYNEIVVNYYDSGTDSIYVFDWTGGNTFRKVFQEAAEGGLPFVGDLYNSGHNVVAFVGGSGLKLYNWNGTTYEKIDEEKIEDPSEIALGDVDQDGKKETIVGGKWLNFYQYERQFQPSQSPEIYAYTNSPQISGKEFWLNVIIGTDKVPVNDLFGISFDLRWSHSGVMQVVSPESKNVVAGDFLGNDVVFFEKLDSSIGKLSVAITRKAGQPGSNGKGVLAKIKFIANVGSNTKIDFWPENITATDPNGNPINIQAKTITIEIVPGIEVWPGDTNNDGVVNQADVLPIGLYWGSTGPARQNASSSWTGQYCQPWTPKIATYADANGDGVVNQVDVLPIGLNWGKFHRKSYLMAMVANANKLQSSAKLSIRTSGDLLPGHWITIDVYVENVTELFGVSFELLYSPSQWIQVVSDSIFAGDFLGSDVIFFPHVDASAGKVGIAITQKAGQSGASGSGLIARIKMHISDQASFGAQLSLQLVNISANDPAGGRIDVDGGDWNLKMTPVELSEFTCRLSGNKVIVRWRTQSEQNNLGFEIERSTSAESGFEKIGFVDGHGTKADPSEYRFIDHLDKPCTYYYRLKQIDLGGRFSYSKVNKVIWSGPRRYELKQNYPNPFNPSTTIEFQLPKSSHVELAIFNARGELVKILARGKLSAGVYRYEWNGQDEFGNTVPNGLYFYRLRAQNFTNIRKMVFLK